MLRTMTFNYGPDITITVREPSNSDFFEGRKMYNILRNESDDDLMIAEKANYCLIQTRTSSISGFDWTPSSSSNPQSVFDGFDQHLTMSRELTKTWASNITDIASSVPLVQQSDGTITADPKS